MPREAATMSLGQHLDELRKRLIYAILGLVPILVVALTFGETILGYLIAPAQRALRELGYPDSFLATGPLELFNTYFYAALMVTIALGAPWAMYQLWRFVAPGLYERERRFVYIVLPLSGALVIFGVVFLFRVVMPLFMPYMVTFGSGIGSHAPTQVEVPAGVELPRLVMLDGDPAKPEPGQYWFDRKTGEIHACLALSEGKPEIRAIHTTRSVGVRPDYRISEYVNLIISLSLAFAGGFQTPVVVLLLGWAGIVTPVFLRKYRRHAFLICAIVAALVTPGDIGSMLAMLAPLYLLFELGILLLVVFPAHRVAGGLTRKQREREQQLSLADDVESNRDNPERLLGGETDNRT